MIFNGVNGKNVIESLNEKILVNPHTYIHTRVYIYIYIYIYILDRVVYIQS